MLNNVLDVGLTMTFKEVYDDSDNFLADFKTTPFYTTAVSPLLTDTTLELIFVLLYNRYGNSEIINDSVNQFKSKLFGTIWAYGPVWAKKMKIQEKLWALSLDGDDIYKGTTAIYNHAANPETAPATQDLEEIDYINDQNVTKYKKSPLEGLMVFADTLNDRLTDDFINKFRKLFKMFITQRTVPTFIDEEES